MKVDILQIHWHEKGPIYSIDFDPNNKKRFVTCGADKAIRVWLLEKKTDTVDKRTGIKFLQTLQRHVSPVNCVRFSPNGRYIASASDCGALIIWEEEQNNREESVWTCKKIIYTANMTDIYDICWSPDSKNILLGLVDNTAQIWDPFRRELLFCLSEHKHFVNGVAWDPLDQFIATQSSDRTTKTYVRKTKKHFAILNTNHRFNLSETNTERTGVYHDETIESFFRRLAFSPDGSILVSVCGCIHGETKTNAAFIQTRDSLSTEPIFFISEFNRPVIAVRFSPVFYKKKQKTVDVFFSLPYMLVFALATQDTVYIYTTDQFEPVASISGIHYTSLTDIAWSLDGENLLVSSTDGFVTNILMEGCFGEQIDDKEKALVEIKERLFKTQSKSLFEYSIDETQEEMKQEEEVINTLVPEYKQSF